MPLYGGVARESVTGWSGLPRRYAPRNDGFFLSITEVNLSLVDKPPLSLSHSAPN